MAKDSFGSGDERFSEFLSKNENWNNFFKMLNKKEFLKSAFFSTLWANFKSRGLTSFRMWTNNEKISFFQKYF